MATNIVLYRRTGLTADKKPIRQAVMSADFTDKNAAVKIQAKMQALYHDAENSGAPFPELDVIAEEWTADATGKNHTAEFMPMDSNLKPTAKEPFNHLEDC